LTRCKRSLKHYFNIQNDHSANINIKSFYSDDSIIVNTDPQYLAMSLANILSNASKHASSTVEVRVDELNATANQSGIVICIEDDGNGIAASDLEHVTKPFWQGPDSATIKGHGMGLAIVARLSEWLQSKLTITNSTRLGGASVSLQFDRS